MGCNSSTASSEPGFGGKKSSIPSTVTFEYFNIGEGRADPIRQMFEYHGQPY